MNLHAHWDEQQYLTLQYADLRLQPGERIIAQVAGKRSRFCVYRQDGMVLSTPWGESDSYEKAIAYVEHHLTAQIMCVPYLSLTIERPTPLST